MKVADFAQVLRQSINEKINQSRGDMPHTSTHHYKQLMEIKEQSETKQ